MADRMRANRTAAIGQEYDFDFGTAAPDEPDTIAEGDIAVWKARLAATLPAAASGDADDAPDAEISTDPATNTVTISIRWDDSKGEEAPQQFDMRTRL